MYRLLNKLTKRKFYYQVKLVITSKKNKELGYQSTQVGVIKKNDILKRRELIKDMIDNDLQQCLNRDKNFSGARITIVIISYIGWF